MKYKMIIFALFSLILPLTGCDKKEDVTNSSISVTTITGAEAKKIMEENEDAIILDVRTPEEFETGHIEKALLLPDYDIAEKAETVLPNKEAVILIYCRSGRRSALSAQALVDMGYTKVYDFGGIMDWDYDIVTD